jgi:outer membrane protein OmpA-like peptidoglycan-associated protein
MRTILFGMLVAFGCGHAAPSPELLSARSAYREAADGPAKDLVPDKLLEAKQSLDSAESKYDDDENSAQARTLAYIAHRKAMIAVAAAGVSAAHKDVEVAERDYKEALEVSLKKSRDRLGRTENSLDKTQTELERQERELREKKKTLEAKDQELSKEKAARADAEERLKAAMKSLEEIAKVKEDSRGTIITLSGAVLFKTNEATLLPIAQSQLRKVAEALNQYDEGRKIVVAGHTDSVGSDSVNQRLSQSRADSVRLFLIQSGVKTERISAVGKGETEPIAENKSPDGRANNRRVEIIVEGAK